MRKLLLVDVYIVFEAADIVRLHNLVFRTIEVGNYFNFRYSHHPPSIISVVAAKPRRLSHQTYNNNIYNKYINNV